MIKTEFGSANVGKNGYYLITSRKEGNMGKRLHRLVWEAHYGIPVPDGYDIHHINGVKTDNRIQNLQCVEHRAHSSFHRNQNKNHSEEHKRRLSRITNTTGYFRVSKVRDTSYKQNFVWAYRYYDDNGRRQKISSISLTKLEEKVIAKGLPWEKFDEADN